MANTLDATERHDVELPHAPKRESMRDAPVLCKVFVHDQSRPELIELSPVVHHQAEIDVSRRFADVDAKAQSQHHVARERSNDAVRDVEADRYRINGKQQINADLIKLA